jgi:peptidyl-prolyl cis-trans isomerase C
MLGGKHAWGHCLGGAAWKHGNPLIEVCSLTHLEGVKLIMAQATARHILVSTEAKCNELKTAIEGGADFAQIAKDNSSCPSSRDGGNLGSFGPGQMVKEFDTVVFSAPINVVQGPVKTQFGYHLLEVTSRQD